MSETSRKSNRSTLRTIILAAISLIIGLVLVIWPGTSSRVIAYILAGLITLAGLIHVAFDYFQHVPFLPFPGLAAGLTVLSIGVFMLIEIEILVNILPVVLGIFLIYLGFVMLQTTIEFAAVRAPRWWLPGVFALVTLALGFLSLFNVFAEILMVFLGISMIVEAVLQIVSLIFMGKASAAASAEPQQEQPVQPAE